MPKGDELKFQGGTTSNTEGEQGNEGRKNRDHAHDGMVRTQRTLFFLHRFSILSRHREILDPSTHYFRINPVFETASEKYDWMNRASSPWAVGTGAPTARSTACSSYCNGHSRPTDQVLPKARSVPL
jgi:hypothetical protein